MELLYKNNVMLVVVGLVADIPTICLRLGACVGPQNCARAFRSYPCVSVSLQLQQLFKELTVCSRPGGLVCGSALKRKTYSSHSVPFFFHFHLAHFDQSGLRLQQLSLSTNQRYDFS